MRAEPFSYILYYTVLTFRAAVSCICRFGSASSGASASLELDIGSSGPFYDMMGNITVYNRQDDCQDMLQCFGLELYSELNDFLEAQRFSGPNQKVYVLFFYRPPPPPRCVQVALLCCCAIHVQLAPRPTGPGCSFDDWSSDATVQGTGLL